MSVGSHNTHHITSEAPYFPKMTDASETGAVNNGLDRARLLLACDEPHRQDRNKN